MNSLSIYIAFCFLRTLQPIEQLHNSLINEQDMTVTDFTKLLCWLLLVTCGLEWFLECIWLCVKSHTHVKIPRVRETTLKLIKSSALTHQWGRHPTYSMKLDRRMNNKNKIVWIYAATIFAISRFCPTVAFIFLGGYIKTSFNWLMSCYGHIIHQFMYFTLQQIFFQTSWFCVAGRK